MLEHGPSLAEAPGFTAEQLESLTRSVEQKKQKLEADINAYARKKQRELLLYEQELLAQYRQMERGQSRHSPDAPSAESQNLSPPSHVSSPPAQSQASPPNPRNTEEKAKRTKHTRVHKREKELFGLVTPIFLPLLDATEPSAAAKKKDRKSRHGNGKIESARGSPPNSERSSPSRDADRAPENPGSQIKTSEKMDQVGTMKAEPSKQTRAPELGKKSKRPAVKKSSLRHSGEKSRRKRVSLVIDDQIVLPTEEIPELPPTSPSETTASSASNSTASLDDAIDPRLMQRHDTPTHEHHDPVHHNLNFPTPLPSSSPTKHTGHTLPPDSSISNSPDAPSLRSPLEYEPPQTATRTFMDPSPPNADLNIPQHASGAPIYANEPDIAEAGEESFSTYVGGIDGSGVDDLDQTGSLGYPSSLGASYLESYMQSRPLSVRMAAADKAGLGEAEKTQLLKGKERGDDLDLGADRVHDVDDDMDVIGSMEGF